MTFGEKSKIIYVYNNCAPTRMIAVHLNNNNNLDMKTIKNADFGAWPMMMIIDNVLHIISDTEHLIFNPQTNTFKNIHRFNNELYLHRLIYLKSTNNLFDGTHGIYNFCVLNKKWNKLNVSMPAKYR